MMKHELSALLSQAAKKAQDDGKLPPTALPEAPVERPSRPEHGDYASSLPLKLSRAARMNPMAIAEAIIASLPATDYLDRAEAAPPGFINLVLQEGWLAREVEAILEAGEKFGSISVGNGETVQVEFVSVNPTGPLHVGHGRGAILGSTLARALEAAGFDVEKEYYLNDAGNQIDAFYRTLYARYCQALGKVVEIPSDGYAGAYMVDLAKEVEAEQGARFLSMPAPEATQELGRIGLGKIVDQIRADLERLGVTFDQWFSEQSLYDTGQFQEAMDLLKGKGYVEERDGAVWFASTALGEDKDNVIVRTSGSPTYFASDIAYHFNKFVKRGFQRVVNIWGADHMGHVSRMKAVVGALGVDPDRLRVILCQMVALRRGKVAIKVSKRTGELVTLREVMDEVGVDACRFFFLARSADSQMDFNLALAKRHSAENPVYYVQYAHARISSILALAQERGLDYRKGDVSLLGHPAELALIRKMLLLPELVETAALTLEPHHLTYYAQDLATTFHAFYKQCRVVSRYPKDLPLSQARLKLAAAARVVLANTLHLMGMTAPEKM
ncbi:MAG: arginine--tRNA ligase [Dehalococcoidia bacterium]|nr:arginine--tRNA ligase [Dehalococcoidia bacterium]